MSLRISDQPDILNLANTRKLRSQILFTNYEWQISNEYRPCEVLPWIDTGVATWTGDSLVLTFLFFQGVAACVHTEMPILK